MNNIVFPNYYNLESYLKKFKLYQSDLRFIKDIVNTKIAMLEYDGLPKTLTSEIIESAIMFNSHLCFYHTKALGNDYDLVLCRYIEESDYNIYWKPYYVSLYGLNGSPLGEHIPYEDIVLIRDNTMDIIPFLFINEYIDKMKELEKTLFNVLKVAQLPLFITGDKKQVAMLKQLTKKILDIEPFAIGDKDLLKDVQTSDIRMVIDPQIIYYLKDHYRNECLSSLGIYAVDQKRERIVTQELNNENDYTNFTYQEALRQRKLAIEEVNRRWNYNITIKEIYDIDFKEEAKLNAYKEKLLADADNINKGGSENGTNVR